MRIDIFINLQFICDQNDPEYNTFSRCMNATDALAHSTRSNSNMRRYNLTSVDEFSGELMKHSIIATKDGFFEANEK